MTEENISISVEQRRLKRFDRLAKILSAGAIVYIVFYLLLYVQTGAWQLAAMAGTLLLSLACAAIAYVLSQQGHLDAAGYWIFIGLVIGYGASELVFSGATAYIAVGGVLLILFAGSITLPHRWPVWLATAGAFGVYIWLVNLFEPLSRYDVTQSPLLHVIIPALTGLLALMLLWQIIRAFRIGNIRTRLLITFSLLALIVAGVVSISAAVVGYRNGRNQVIAQLESVAALKEAEINTWIDTLRTELRTLLADAEEIQQANLVLTEESTSDNYQDAYAQLSSDFQKSVELAELFEEVFLIDRQGRVVLSTDPVQEGKIRTTEDYFERGLDGFYVQPPYYSTSLGRVTVVFARPMINQDGQTIGVLAGRAGMDALSGIMSELAGLGETGETYLVGANHALLTESRFDEENVYVYTEGADAAIEGQTSGSGLYEDYRGVPTVGVYRWLPDLQVALLAEQDQSEAFSGPRRVIYVNAGVTLLILVLASGASLLSARSIANPLSNLAKTATQIAEGDLDRMARVEREDEIGALAQAFNRMTGQLRQLIGSLEQRVAERTRDLEQRSAYLEASAEVGRAAASILEADRLIQQVVELIRDRFDLYYTGLFLVDEAGEWAVLEAGTGEAGRKMLAQEHRLRVGGDSMIGQCVIHSEARIALDVGEEAVHFDNPLLPETRSEGALPLRSRGRTIGALTIQSTEEAAFDRDTITVLQTMADQVAVALDNARLFTEVDEALEAERRAYGEISREAWSELLRVRTDWGYRYAPAQGTIAPANGDWQPEMLQAARAGEIVRKKDGDGKTALAVPLKIRGEVIGILDFRKEEAGQAWADEEIALLTELAEQLSLALEGARLYQDTQRRAVRERLIGEITGRMRQTLDLETVLHTAVREIGETLELATVDVQLLAEDDLTDEE